MHKTTAAVAVLAIASLTALVVVLATLSPLASRALASTHTVAAHPWSDAQGEPYCPAGVMYDTEDSAMGDQGIVCYVTVQGA